MAVGSEDGDGDENESKATGEDGSDRVAYSHPIIIPTGAVQKGRRSSTSAPSKGSTLFI